MTASVQSASLANPIKERELRAYTVIRLLRAIAQQTSDSRHRLNTDNALDSEVGLIGGRAGEVVRAQLVRRDE